MSVACCVTGSCTVTILCSLCLQPARYLVDGACEVCAPPRDPPWIVVLRRHRDLIPPLGGPSASVRAMFDAAIAELA